MIGVFLQIEPGKGIERVGIWRRETAVVGRQIALDGEELVERRLTFGGLGHVRHLQARHGSGHERINVHEGIGGDRGCLLRHQRGGQHQGSMVQGLATGRKPGCAAA